MYCKQEHKYIISYALACKILGVNSVCNQLLLLVQEHFVVHNLFFYMHMKHPNSTPSQKHKALPSMPPPQLCRLINLQNSPRPRQRRHPCVIIIVIVIVIISS